MSEQDTQQDVPHDDEIDVEGPNESAPGHNPSDADDDTASEDDSA